MKRLIATFLGVALAFAFVPGLVAQSIRIEGPSYSSVQFVTDWSQDDTAALGLEAPVFLVKYVGDQESGTLDLNSNAIEFFSGPLGTEVINGSTGYDVNTGDVCGTTNDSLDVTDAECDTPAELVNVVNDSGAPWVAVLLNVVGTESLATAAEYEDMADAQAKRPGGFGVRIDNSDVDTFALLVRPDIGSGDAVLNADPYDRFNIEPFLTKPVVGATAASYYLQDLKVNPFGGRQVALTHVLANVDSTTAWTLNIFCVQYRANGRRVERQVYGTSATTDATDLSLTQLGIAPLVCGPGEVPLIQVVDDALVTSVIGVSAQFLPL